MLYIHQKLPDGPFPVLVNLGTDSTTKVMDISQDHHRGDGAQRRRVHVHRHAARLAGRSAGRPARHRQDPRARLVLPAHLDRSGAHRGPPAPRHRSLPAHRGHAVREATIHGLRRRDLAPRRGQRRRVRREGLPRHRPRARPQEGASSLQKRVPARCSSRVWKS